MADVTVDPFAEIAATRDSGGTFESFTQQFLEALGLTTIEPPSRGPDGGHDMIMAERFKTKLDREIEFRWLVSSKFRTGRTISPTDEPMIIDRLQRHNCNGFIGFYSTGPSSNLTDHINALSKTTVAQVHMFEKAIYDGSSIIGKLNRDITRFGPLMQTFMPTYYQQIKPSSTEDPFKINTGEGI